MKKLLIIGLLAGCGATASVPQATTVPDPEPVQTPVAEVNNYKDVVPFLVGLVNMSTEEFAVFCGEVGGQLTEAEVFNTCSDGTAGFAINHAGEAINRGSAVLVPGEHGIMLAQAVLDDLGPPVYTAGDVAAWQIPGYALVFSPVPGNAAYILVLERADAEPELNL